MTTEPAGALDVRKDQALAVSAAFLALFSIVGFALYGLPFFYDHFVTDLGWNRQQVTSGNAYSKVLVAVTFGFIAGLIVDRFGPRRIMLAGIVMAGGALVGLSHVHSLSGFYIFYVFNALGYVFGGPLPNQVLLSRWFPAGRDTSVGIAYLALGVAVAVVPIGAHAATGGAGLSGVPRTLADLAIVVVLSITLLLLLVRRVDVKRGKAMGLAYLGIGVGGALVPLLAQTLIEHLGWRSALQLLGILMVAIALPVAFFVREPPRLPAPDAAAGSALVKVLRQPAFYLLAVGSMASIGAVGGTIQNLKLYLRLDRQLAPGDIASVLSLLLAGSVVGRVAMGWLADRWPRKYVMLLIYVIVAGSIPLMVFAPTLAALEVFAFLFGVGLGGDYMIIPLMAADLFGVQRLGRVMGLVLTADSVAEAMMPMGVAAIREHAGTYTPGFLLLCGLAAIGAIAVIFLPRAAAAPGPV